MSDGVKKRKYNSTNELEFIKKSETKNLVAGKVFVNRNSMLTDLLEQPNFNAISNMFLSLLILLFLMTLSQDWLKHGLFNHYHHLQWVSREFNHIFIVIFLLLCMYAVSCSIYKMTENWLIFCDRFDNHKTIATILFVLYYIFSVISLIFIPIYVFYDVYIPPCSSAFVAYEQVRLVMKLHAFVRTCFHDKHKVTFSKFMYFMIVPTLVYRDDYPKRPQRDWKLALKWLIQFVLCVIFIYYIYTIMLRDNFINFHPKMNNIENLMPLLFKSLLPTILMIFVMFYCVLHVWMNLFAELTRFGDRLFYKDWWNSTSLGDYYRTWNNVVHDWLYNYIYTDIIQLLVRLTGNTKISKSIATVCVILLSALVHEYILAFCFRFFYPVLLFVFFIFGSCLYFFKVNRESKYANIFFWFGLFVGNTIFVTFYACEWYARRNCVRQLDDWWDFVVPRSWYCHLK